LSVSSDQHKRPDVGGFDAKPADDHVLLRQFRAFPGAFAAAPSSSAAESEKLGRY